MWRTVCLFIKDLCFFNTFSSVYCLMFSGWGGFAFHLYCVLLSKPIRCEITYEAFCYLLFVCWQLCCLGEKSKLTQLIQNTLEALIRNAMSLKLYKVKFREAVLPYYCKVVTVRVCRFLTFSNLILSGAHNFSSPELQTLIVMFKAPSS